MNKQYNTLYSRDSLGNIRIWKMEQNGSKYRTIAGLQNGEQVISEWTVAEGKNHGKKNETSSVGQATKEIEAKYKKQKKTGYFDDINNVDDMSYIEPMLAKLYKDYSDKIDLSKGEYILQCKFNGMRCIATKNGLFTRKGEKYLSCPHVEESLIPFFEKYPDAVLDGELFNNDLRQQLNEISKLVRRTVNISQDDLERSEKLVRYYVYDGYDFGINKDCCYRERKKWIDTNVVNSYRYIMPVKDFVINAESDLDKHYSSFIDDGHEGVMLRYSDMGYEHKRSKNLLKVKPEDSEEAIIIDIKEGTGNWRGTGKTITLDWNGKIFDASSKGSYEEAKDFLEDKKNWIGKTVEFLYNGLTGKGTPNFARVDINNCLKLDR
jgi:ATP-dependent DNA ligase